MWTFQVKDGAWHATEAQRCCRRDRFHAPRRAGLLLEFEKSGAAVLVCGFVEEKVAEIKAIGPLGEDLTYEIESMSTDSNGSTSITPLRLMGKSMVGYRMGAHRDLLTCPFQ